MRETRIEVSYDADVRDGLREAYADGTIVPATEGDLSWVVAIERVTRTTVSDGRGVNYAASGTDRETLARLTIEQAIDLARSIVENIGYAAIVGERRVLTADKP